MSNKGIQENMSKVLVLAGLPGSGKSVASDIAKSMNIPVIIMGNGVKGSILDFPQNQMVTFILVTQNQFV